MYFDYSATTPMDSEILDLYCDIQKKYFANTTSLHSLGQRSNYLYEKAKREILETLKVKNHDIIFTSNATEANNLSILGYLSKYSKGKVITTKIEHPSVYEVFKHLENNGFEVCYLNVDEAGIINLDELKKELTKDTLLVSIMWVNNIVGSIQPIDKVIEILKEFPKTKLHVDMVQGLTKIVPNFDMNDIDMFTMSTHKIYGPKGIGTLIYRKNIEISPFLYGSSAQNGLKPGTFDLGLVACTCRAVKKYFPQTLNNYNYVNKLKEKLIEGIKKIDNIHINSINGSPYIINISIPNINGETIVHQLEQKDIYVSTGSSCSSKLKKPEKTILAMTNSIDLATSSIRISLSHLTKDEEVDKLLIALGEIKK